MDLLSGLRRGDSSRGGRAEFSWDAVKEDKDRENYLGHSLMAPVGRWQRGKDLTWYAKSKSDGLAMTAEEKRKEEIRQIKEAEQDALAEALGFPAVRGQMDQVDERDVQKAIREAGVGDENQGRGVGFGRHGSLRDTGVGKAMTDEGWGMGEYRPLDLAEDERRGRMDDKDRERARRHRSRSDRSRRGRDRDHDRERRHGHHHYKRSRPRSRRRHHRDDEYRDADRRRHGEERERERERHERRRSRRSRSP